MKVEPIAEKYAFDFKKPDELFQLVGTSLVKGGYAAEESGKGTSNKRKIADMRGQL